jgi:hypothetical protein
MSGKGSRPRPIEVPKEQFDINWKRIFEKAKSKEKFVPEQENKKNK